MKITPITGPNMGSVQAGNQSSVTPDRREAAKQAFLGNTGVQITQSETPVDPQVLADAYNKKSLKMRTNYSPDRPEEEVLDPESVTPNTQEVVTEETRPISPHLAELARQRRALVKERQAIEAEKKALADQRTNSTSIDVAKLKASPLGTLLENGVSYEQLTQELMAQQSGVSPEVRELQDKLKALETGFETKLQERDAQSERAVLAEMQREATQLVETDPKFKAIKLLSTPKVVTDLIHKQWKQTGEVLDVYEAAELIKNQLVEDYSKAAEVDEIRSRFTPETAPITQRPNSIKTLTNRDTAARPQSARARAIAAFNGTKR